MNKKNIFLIIGVTLLIGISFLVIADNETLIITISDVNTTVGSQNVEVPILLENNVTVYGIQLSISHHPYLIFDNVSLTSRTEDAIIEFNDVDGEILIAAVFEDGISAGNGTIFNLTLDISVLALGDYILNSTDTFAANIDTGLYNIEFNPGKVQVDIV
jgi:hypothetical protein